jgi:hypothetical protein
MIFGSRRRFSPFGCRAGEIDSLTAALGESADIKKRALRMSARRNYHKTDYRSVKAG